jgi:putative Holliday junction resolvase
MITLLGFDFGTRKIGVAVGQSVTATATALTTLTTIGGKPDWPRIAQLIDEWQPAALIVGLPYEMTDQEAELAPRVKRFARQLQGRYHLPVHMADERLTTREAWDRLGKAAHRDAWRLDALAAKLILETWLSEAQEGIVQARDRACSSGVRNHKSSPK